jgi:hypothetical protein
VPDNLEAAKKLLISASIGSCTCETKSPELIWHALNCRYATIMMALENVEMAAAARSADVSFREALEKIARDPDVSSLQSNPDKNPRAIASAVLAGWRLPAATKIVVNTAEELAAVLADGDEQGVCFVLPTGEVVRGDAAEMLLTLEAELAQARSQVERQTKALQKIADLIDAEDACDPLDDAISIAAKALASTEQRPTCKQCGLEDGACICRHLSSHDGGSDA